MMEYITLRLDSTNEVEQWYVRNNYFIVLLHRRHVSTYIQVIFRPSITDKSIKCYTRSPRFLPCSTSINLLCFYAFYLC